MEGSCEEANSEVKPKDPGWLAFHINKILFPSQLGQTEWQPSFYAHLAPRVCFVSALLLSFAPSSLSIGPVSLQVLSLPWRRRRQEEEEKEKDQASPKEARGRNARARARPRPHHGARQVRARASQGAVASRPRPFRLAGAAAQLRIVRSMWSESSTEYF